MSKEEKKNKTDQTPESFVLDGQIKAIVKGLTYMSETDARIVPFVGTAAAEVSAAEILKQTGGDQSANIEQRDFNEFFARLTKIENWFGDEEKATAAKFSALKDVLQSNLRDLTVFKIGKIQLDIYVVGLPAENILSGIKTKAVET